MVEVGEGSGPEFGGGAAARDSLRDVGMANLRAVMMKVV